MQSSPWLRVFMGYAWPRFLLVAIAVIVLVATISATVGGPPPFELLVVLTVSLLIGAIVMGSFPAGRATIVLAIIVGLQFLLMGQMSEPWSSSSSVLIPGNAGGAIVGDVVRRGIAASRRKVSTDVWVVNDVSEPRTDLARRGSSEALLSWDSGVSGGFSVARDNARFYAVGNSVSGFIVHCAADSRDDKEWRVLGSICGTGETEIRIPSGPAYAPSGVVVDLETVEAALRGFFHYRGPDPGLSWTSGDEVLDLRFG